MFWHFSGLHHAPPSPPLHPKVFFKMCFKIPCTRTSQQDTVWWLCLLRTLRFLYSKLFIHIFRRILQLHPHCDTEPQTMSSVTCHRCLSTGFVVRLFEDRYSAVTSFFHLGWTEMNVLEENLSIITIFCVLISREKKYTEGYVIFSTWGGCKGLVDEADLKMLSFHQRNISQNQFWMFPKNDWKEEMKGYYIIKA